MKNLNVTLIFLLCLIFNSCSKDDYPKVDASYVVKELPITYIETEAVPEPNYLRAGQTILINSVTELDQFFQECQFPACEELKDVDFNTQSVVLFFFLTEITDFFYKHEFEVFYENESDPPVYSYTFREFADKTISDSLLQETSFFYTGIVTKKITPGSAINLTFTSSIK